MKIILFFLSILLAFFSFSQKKDTKSSVKNQLKDFKVFKTEILSNSAGIYFYNTKEQFQSSLDSLEKSLSYPQSEIDIYKIYSKCVAKIHCGHTIIIIKDMYDKFLKSRSTLPFEVHYINNKLFIKNDFIGSFTQLLNHTEITSINGESIPELTTYFSQYISSDGNNTTHINERLEFKFMFYYYFLKNQQTQFTIEYISERKDTIKTTLAAIFPKKESTIKESDYFNSIERHIDTLNNRAKLILPNPLPRNNTYKLQLDTFFVYLDQYSIKNLIIDLRGNTGGLSQQYLTGFFCDSNYTYEYRTLKEMRKPNHYYQKPFDAQRLSIFCTRIATRNGRTTTTKESEPNYPQFKGNIYILTDGWTFSAASNLTSILKQHSGAITVGEETGGSYLQCSSGNLILKLPKSKMQIKLNPMKYVNSVPVTEHKGGVIPTYTVKPSDKWDSDEDLQLQFVYDLINHSQSSIIK